MHISVLIPAFNHENYIKELIVSLSEDDEIIGEIIIIDDASIDNTFDVAKKLSKENRKITVFRNKKNIGLSENLNNLVKMAKCDYIALMASDDLSIPGSLKKKLKFLMQAKNCDLIFTDCEVIDSSGDVKFESGLTKLYDMNVRAMDTDNFELYREIILNWGVPGSTLLIRRQFFDAFHFKKWSKLDDLDLFMHAVNHQSICFYNIKSTRYRQHSGSANRSLIRRIKMKISLLKLIIYYFLLGRRHLRQILALLVIKKILR